MTTPEGPDAQHPEVQPPEEQATPQVTERPASSREPESFAANVERLVAEGKLTAAEAAELLEPVQPDPEPSAAPTQVMLHKTGGREDLGVPPDLRLDVSGYGLRVIYDPSLPEPRLTSNHEGQLHLRAGPDGWSVSGRGRHRGLNLQAVLSLPFTPRDVRADVSGGNLNLMGVSGAARIEVSGGNATLGNAGELRAEVSGGNLTAGAVAGALEVEVNGGNLSVAGASELRAEVNGGQLSWVGRLEGGRHKLEVNGGQATLRLDPGSNVALEAKATLGGISASFPLQKTGGMLQASYTGMLGSGSARLDCEVNAGQIRLVTT